MVRAVAIPFFVIFFGIAALPAQQPRTAAPAPRAATPQPQITRNVGTLAAPRPAASALHVGFHDGLLTLHAHNANLADVLNAIQRKTGASFEFPNSASQEPVAVDLGPASPHDVLASLLNGSRFDYIVLGRQDDPNEIATVLLQEKTGANGAPAAEPSPAYPAAGSYQQPEEQEQPDEVPTEVQDEQQAQQPTPEDQNPKTPEQMLEELKQMQNQQQQQQQQQQQRQQPAQQPGQPPQPGQPVAPGVQQQVPQPYPQGPGPQSYPPPSPQPDDSQPNPH